MIENIILSLAIVLSVSLGEYASLIVFKSETTIKQYLLQIILFIIIFNLFSDNILVPELFINQILIYCFISFSSSVISKLTSGLIFKSFNKIIFKSNKFNKSFIKLAINLNKILDKKIIISLFKKSNFNTNYLDHLKKILK